MTITHLLNILSLHLSFQKISKTIADFLKNHEKEAYEKGNNEYKLPLSDALFCAGDIPRNRLFFQAIEQRIKELKPWGIFSKKITVIDAGAGTGILGFFSLSLGADRCYFLEHNPVSLDLCKELAKHLKLDKKCVFLECDATYVELPENYDLLISETITSGFVSEDFPQIIYHLKQYGKEKSFIIPQSFEIQIQEFDDKNTLLQRSFYSFESDQGFLKKQIETHPQTQKLTFFTDAELAPGIHIKSGDCMSLLNERSIKQNEKHPIFSWKN